VVPEGNAVSCNPVPKFSRKIGASEFPGQEPSCAKPFSEDKKKLKIMIILRLLKYFLTYLYLVECIKLIIIQAFSY
jgi:hypothetical protein